MLTRIERVVVCNTMETIIRDECKSMIDNLLSRVAIGNEFSSLMFATTGGFVQFVICAVIS